MAQVGCPRPFPQHVYQRRRRDDANLVATDIARDSIQFEKYEHTEQGYSNSFEALFDIRRIDAAPDER